MAADHFCLIWNNFQNSILSALGNLQSSQDLVDVTLMCEGRNVRAHKVILSACSPYFRNLFKETPCQHPVIILKDVTHYDLTALLQFMYQGEVMVTQDCLASFLKTAELLQISGLAGTAAAASSGIDPIESVPRAPPDPVGNPPDSPGTAINKINSDLSLTKHKRSEKVEKEPTESTTMAPFTETDPQQSCSYQQPAPIIIKTESVDREYDDMDTDPAELKNATDDSFDNSTAHGDEPSILERSLKAQSGETYRTSTSPTSSPQQCVLKKMGSTRRRCTSCYERLKNEHGRKYASVKCKQTPFKCTKCNSFFCMNCFFEKHISTRYSSN